MEKEIIPFEEKEIPLHINRLVMQSGGSYRGMHAHVAAEVILVHRGELCCTMANGTVTAGANQILMVNSNVGHKLTAAWAEITYLQLGSALFREAADTPFSALQAFVSHNKAKPYMLFSRNSALEAILAKILQRYAQHQPHSRRYLKAYLYELVAFMYESGFIAAASLSAQNLKKIEAAVAYIDAHFKTQITLGALCRAASYNKFALCHAFKEVTGATVFEYVNYLRIYHAAEKLKQKHSTILEIATECGFSSASYFHRVFNSVMGCSPSAYRKLLTQSNVF